MTILTINLTHCFKRDLQQSLTEEVCQVKDVAQALHQIKVRDFTCIITDVRQRDCATEDLAQLIAATSLGTTIIGLGSARTVSDPDYWRAQGIVLIYELDDDRLLELIIKYCSNAR
ncbi:MAG: DNA-binding NtrC family response regulator [Candidatus Azotimanducaceae bacterium]|jgi:DNA-binding NtrC family response regulator